MAAAGVDTPGAHDTRARLPVAADSGWPAYQDRINRMTAAERWGLLLGRRAAVLEMLEAATTPERDGVISNLAQDCKKDPTGSLLAASLSISSLPFPLAGCSGDEGASEWVPAMGAALQFAGDVVPEMRPDGSCTPQEQAALVGKWAQVTAAAASSSLSWKPASGGRPRRFLPLNPPEVYACWRPDPCRHTHALPVQAFKPSITAVMQQLLKDGVALSHTLVGHNLSFAALVVDLDLGELVPQLLPMGLTPYQLVTVNSNPQGKAYGYEQAPLVLAAARVSSVTGRPSTVLRALPSAPDPLQLLTAAVEECLHDNEVAGPTVTGEVTTTRVFVARGGGRFGFHGLGPPPGEEGMGGTPAQPEVWGTPMETRDEATARLSAVREYWRNLVSQVQGRIDASPETEGAARGRAMPTAIPDSRSQGHLFVLPPLLVHFAVSPCMGREEYVAQLLNERTGADLKSMVPQMPMKMAAHMTPAPRMPQWGKLSLATAILAQGVETVKTLWAKAMVHDEGCLAAPSAPTALPSLQEAQEDPGCLAHLGTVPTSMGEQARLAAVWTAAAVKMLGEAGGTFDQDRAYLTEVNAANAGATKIEQSAQRAGVNRGIRLPSLAAWKSAIAKGELPPEVARPLILAAVQGLHTVPAGCTGIGALTFAAGRSETALSMFHAAPAPYMRGGGAARQSSPPIQTATPHSPMASRLPAVLLPIAKEVIQAAETVSSLSPWVLHIWRLDAALGPNGLGFGAWLSLLGWSRRRALVVSRKARRAAHK